MRLALSSLTFYLLVHCVLAAWAPRAQLERNRESERVFLFGKFPQLKEASDINAASLELMKNHVREWKDWAKIWDAFMSEQPTSFALDYLSRYSGIRRRDPFDIIQAAMAQIIREHPKQFVLLIAKSSFKSFVQQCRATTFAEALQQLEEGIEEDVLNVEQHEDIVTLLKDEPALYVLFTLEDKVESILMKSWREKWNKLTMNLEGC